MNIETIKFHYFGRLRPIRWFLRPNTGRDTGVWNTCYSLGT